MKNEELKVKIQDRSKNFAIQVITTANRLPRTPAGFAIASQIVRSGTSVGANIEEAQSAQSKKDFIHCLLIALKEARETLYWLKVIEESKLIGINLSLLRKENDEIIRILVVIIKKTRLNSSL